MNLEVKFRIITIYGGGKENIKITLQYIQDKKKRNQYRTQHEII